MHPYSVIIAFLGFLLITSKEIVWFRPWTGAPVFNLIVTLLFGIHFVSLFTRYHTKQAKLTIRPRLNWKKWPGMSFLLYFCILYGLYFFFHEAYIGDSSRSLKYGIYVFFLVSLLCDSYDLENIPKIFAFLSIITSIGLILQFGLIAVVLNGDISNVPHLVSYRPDGSIEFDQANPFWLGLIGDNSLVDYGWIEFYRANAFTTEPKYCSQVLIAGLVSIFTLKDARSNRQWLGVFIICTGLLISHAYSTLSVFLFAMFIYKLGRSKRALLYSLLTVAVLVLTVVLLSVYGGALKGYAGQRVNSFLSQTEMFALTFSTVPDPIGKGVEDPASKRVGLPPIPRNLIQFGWIGVVFQYALLFLVLAKSMRGIYLIRSPKQRVAIALACSLSLIFVTFFNSEPLSPLYSYLYAIVFHLVGEKELALAPKPRRELVQFGRLSPGYNF